MRWRHDTAAEEGAGMARFAWLVSFFATLSLVAILALAKSAQALPVLDAINLPTPAAASPPAAVDAEEEDDGDEEDDFFEVEECGEDDADCEAEDEEGGPEAPEDCLLSSAEATVFAAGAQEKLRLVIHYTTVEPTVVAVSWGLHGSKGSLYLGQSKERFGRSGAFRQTETLTEPQMAKAAGARDFTIQLYAAEAPRFCRKYFEQHLTARHAAPSGLTWADPEANFRR
jgi:hypothetical protein